MSKLINKAQKRKAVVAAVTSHARFGNDDYDIPCYNLANILLGKLLVRQIGNTRLTGRIIETECYLGGEDKASHSFNGR